MAKKMLIDATHPEETRVVVADGNKVEDFDFESLNKRQLAGNIYLAKVTRVEPSLQAAFVEYGGNRHGFLAFSEIHPDYYQIPVADREALLAEEAREEEAERDREDAAEKPKAKRTRKPAKAKAKGERKPRQNSVSGLEVIDIDASDDASTAEMAEGFTPATPESGEHEDASEVSAGNGEGESTDPAKPRDAAATEDATTPADATATEPSPDAEAAADATDDAETETPAAATETETEAEKSDADDGDDGDPGPGRTMAESAGLGDDERVTGEVGESPDSESADDNQDGSAQASEKDRAIAENPQPEMAAAAEADAGGAESESDGTGSASDKADTKADRPRRRRRRGRDDRGKAAKGSADDDASNDKPGDNKAGADDGAENGQSDDDAEQPEQIGDEGALEEASRSRSRLRRRYRIQDVVKVRQILLVQVVKEERGNKGAALTTYISLAGRYCVLMPNTARGGGISRKITNVTDRKRLRGIAGELDVPQGMGLIVRTAGAERTRAEIRRDYEFLLRQWEQVRDLTLKSVAPTLIYEEGSLIKRSIRDLYSREIDQVLVEGEAGYREAKEYMKMLMPSHARNVQPYNDQIPLFSRFQVESYLNGMFNPRVQLKSGGYLVIGITEALVAIDVNSGKATKQGSIEETALHTNLEAAEEVARQLRLRDLAGLIVIDFIDMDEGRNNRAVEKRLKDKLKSDRARLQIGRISAFGLLEMSRQRLRPGMLEASTTACPHCHGVGLIRSDDSLALAILREVEEEALRGRSDEVTVRAPVAIANYLVNAKRLHVAQLEARHGISVLITGDPALTSPEYEIERSKGERKHPAPAARDVLSAMAIAASDETEATGKSDAGHAEAADHPDDNDRSRRRRSRRGGRRRRGGGSSEDANPAEAQQDASGNEAESETGAEGDNQSGSRRGRGRGRRRNRNGDGQEHAAGTDHGQADANSEGATDDASAAPVANSADTGGEAAGKAPAPAVTEAEKADNDVAAGPGQNSPEEDIADPAAGADAPVVVAAVAAASVADTADETEAGGDVTTDNAPNAETALPATAATGEIRSEEAPAEKPTARKRGWWSLGF